VCGEILSNSSDPHIEYLVFDDTEWMRNPPINNRL